MLRAALLIAVLFQSGTAQELIVRFEPSVTVSARPGIAAAAFGSNDPAVQHILDRFAPQRITPLFEKYRHRLPPGLRNIQVWRLKTAATAAAARQALQALPNVAYVQPHLTRRVFAAPGDPLAAAQWYLQTIRADADLPPGDPAVLVGVIDTGIDYQHEDLQGQLWVNAAEDVNGNGRLDAPDLNGIDEDGNGYVDDVIGWDFTDAPDFPDGGDYRDPDPDPLDEFPGGHGTAVAGIIAAAAENGRGIRGIAPGVRVMNLRAATAAGIFEEDDIAEAILYAVENGCKVVNMSFGDAAVSFLLRDVIRYGRGKGVLFVAAAGNSGDQTPNYPAALDETIAVGAIDSTGQLAGFSNYGSHINLVAPGRDILTTLSGNGYGPVTGTSFAAPMVSAALALLCSQHPGEPAEQLTGALYAGCRDAGSPGWDSFYGHGIPDIAHSLRVSEQGLAQILTPANGGAVAAPVAAIVGSAFGPQLLDYSVSFAPGRLPLQMQTIAQVAGRQVLNDTLALWNTTALPDSIYTLEVRLRQRGLSDLVWRSEVMLDRSPPQPGPLTVTRLLDGQHEAALLEFETGDPTIAKMKFRRSGEGDFDFQTSRYFLKKHHFILSADAFAGETDLFFELENSAGLTGRLDDAGQPFRLELADRVPPGDFLVETAPWPFRGIFLPGTTDFNADGTPEIVFAEQTGSTVGALRLAQWVEGVWQFTRLSEHPLIPRDAGVIHPGQGVTLAGGFGGTSLLLGGNAPGELPGAVVWEDTSNFWVSRLADFDGDAPLEMLARHLARWKIFDISADFQLTPRQILPPASEGNNQFGVPRTLLGDFDGDGRREIALEDRDGDVVVYEEDAAGTYDVIWTQRLPGSGGEGLLVAADLRGEDRPLLVSAVRHSPETDGQADLPPAYWALTVWESTGNNAFALLAQQNFLGATPATPGRDLQNGLSIADLDGDGRDELIFTPHPRAYVLDWQEEGLRVRWFREGVSSNAAPAADFDGNGVTDLALNLDNGIQLYQTNLQTDRPPAPAGLRAEPLDTAAVRLRWLPAPGAGQYRIYRRTPGFGFSLRDSTQTTVFVDTLVENGTEYTYAVTQINPPFPLPESRLSVPATARPNPPPQLRRIEAVAPQQLRLTYSEPMGESAFETARYHLQGIATGPVGIARGGGSTVALLSFANPFPPGRHLLVLANIRDAQNTPLRGDTLAIPFDMAAPLLPLYLQSVEMQDKRRLVLRFNRPVDPGSAADVAHYRLEPDGQILAARADSADGRIVRLHLDGKNRLGSLGVTYFLTVSGVRGIEGQILAGPPANRLAIVGHADDLTAVRVYPNPYRPEHTALPLMFANVPDGSEIYIFNPSGHLIRRLSGPAPAGGIPWDLQTGQGKTAANGVYLYVVRFRGQEKQGKLLILR